MAKVSTIVKNERKIRMAAKQGPKRKEIKKQLLNPALSDDDREALLKRLQDMPRNGNPIRTKSRCNVTGRGRGVLTKFGLSRLKFREYALMGLLPGVTKASW